MYKEVGKKILVNFVHFHCSGKNKVHVCVQAAKYEVCKSGDPPNKLNPLIFAFKIGIAQHKDEW